MKCVKNVGSGEVRRLSEAHALELVEKGVAKFCPKAEWKALKIASVSVTVENKEAIKAGLEKKAREKKSRQDKVNYHKDKKSHK